MNGKEKRRHPRLPREEPLSVRFDIPQPGQLENKSIRVYGTSTDMSAQGLQARIDHELTTDQELEIWIVLVDDHETYNLMGRVTWVKAQPEGDWTAGIVILPDKSQDYDSWDELFR